jgi:tRNA pseudouridine55 synthase
MMKRRRRGRPLDGWLILDKPQGPTSTDMVNRVKRLFDAEKAGHGGTLDPLATGLLPIAFGAATKTVPYVMDGTKRYRFTLRFGEARDTDDADGAVTETTDVRPDDAAIEAVLPAFRRSIRPSRWPASAPMTWPAKAARRCWSPAPPRSTVSC